MEKSENKKNNGEQSDLCDLEQVTLKPQLQVHHCLAIFLLWYHSLLWGDSIRKRHQFRRTELRIRRPTRGIGDRNFFLSDPLTLERNFRQNKK